MTIPAGVSHVTISGTLTGGEIWQTGFWTSGAAATTPEGATTHAAILAALFNAAGGLRDTITNRMIAADESVERLSVAEYPTGGPTASFVGESLAHTAGSSTRSLPNQVAVVASTRTGQAGRRHRGRMYFPLAHGSAGPLAGGQYSSTDAQFLATSVAQFFTDVNAQPIGGDFSGELVVVLSKVAGTSLAMTSIIVDTKLDIQRRRANSESINAVTTAAIL